MSRLLALLFAPERQFLAEIGRGWARLRGRRRDPLGPRIICLQQIMHGPSSPPPLLAANGLVARTRYACRGPRLLGCSTPPTDGSSAWARCFRLSSYLGPPQTLHYVRSGLRSLATPPQPNKGLARRERRIATLMRRAGPADRGLSPVPRGSDNLSCGRGDPAANTASKLFMPSSRVALAP